MPVSSSPKILDIARSKDPKSAIQKAVGELTDRLAPTYNRVLVGTYIQPERRKSGLYLSPDTLKEDEYQGTVGLILAMGPDAQQMADESKGPQIGDWVEYSIRQSVSATINGAPCRWVQYEALRAKIAEPSVVYGDN